MFDRVCGMPLVPTVALEKLLLLCDGVKGMAPRTDPARARSAEVARTALAELTAPRPKSAARTLVTAFV